MNTVATEDPRQIRQASLMPALMMEATRVAVAGVGAVGRQLVIQLASAGQKMIEAFDHDIVEIENIGPQGWRQADIDKPKVQALIDDLGHMGRVDEQMVFHNARFPLGGVTANVLFLCVDSIETRRQLFEAYAPHVDCIIDARVGMETIRILAACGPEDKEYYPETCFPESEVQSGVCTARMSIYQANIAAGLMMAQYSKWLRDMPLDRDMTLNLLSMEMFPTE